MAEEGAAPDMMTKLQNDFLVFLYEQQSAEVLALMAKMEEATGVKREHASLGVAALLAVYLIVDNAAQFVCNLISFAYPAYASIKAIESTQKDDDTQWLTYWTVFALFSLLDFFGDAIMSVVPLYWLAKCVFLLYLYLPMFNGAEKLYSGFIKPAMLKNQEVRQMASGADNSAVQPVAADTPKEHFF